MEVLVKEARILCAKKEFSGSNEEIENYYYSLQYNDIYDMLSEFKDIVKKVMSGVIKQPEQKVIVRSNPFSIFKKKYLNGKSCASFTSKQVRDLGLNPDTYF